MKINVEKPMTVVEAKPGDIAYFDNDYWLIAWLPIRYYCISLTRANGYVSPELCSNFSDVISYLVDKKAIIYDGSKSKLDLVIKEPKDDHD